MRKLFIIIALLWSSTAYADEFYNSKINELWQITGYIPADKTTNNRCEAFASYKDGSRVVLVKDLIDDELYMVIRNIDWALVKDKDDENMIRLNMMNGERIIDGGSFGWAIHTKDTVVIPGMKYKPFAAAAWTANRMHIVMPTVQNIKTPFPGRQIISGLADCIKAYNSWLKMHPDVVPDISVRPGDSKPLPEGKFSKKERI